MKPASVMGLAPVAQAVGGFFVPPHAAVPIRRRFSVRRGRRAGAGSSLLGKTALHLRHRRRHHDAGRGQGSHPGRMDQGLSVLLALGFGSGFGRPFVRERGSHERWCRFGAGGAAPAAGSVQRTVGACAGAKLTSGPGGQVLEPDQGPGRTGLPRMADPAPVGAKGGWSGEARTGPHERAMSPS